MSVKELFNDLEKGYHCSKAEMEKIIADKFVFCRDIQEKLKNSLTLLNDDSIINASAFIVSNYIGVTNIDVLVFSILYENQLAIKDKEKIPQTVKKLLFCATEPKGKGLLRVDPYFVWSLKCNSLGKVLMVKKQAFRVLLIVFLMKFWHKEINRRQYIRFCEYIGPEILLYARSQRKNKIKETIKLFIAKNFEK